MSPCPSPSLLVQLVSGRGSATTGTDGTGATLVDDRQRAELEAHLDACASCRIAVSTLVTTRTPASAAEPTRKVSAPAVRAAGTPSGQRYEITGELGRGASGVVYRAFDAELRRPVALKVAAVQRGPDGLLPPEAVLRRERALREARAVARVAHPNVVAVHDVGELDGDVFVAMELVEGDTLDGWLAERPRATAEVLAVLAQCAAGLAAAHARGVVHRDFKPRNVFVGVDGRARVGDFGLALDVAVAPAANALVPPRGAAAPDASSARDVQQVQQGATDADPRLTRTGGAVGTPAYMAPEQHRGEAVDARADQFALAVVAWEALFGARPFAGDDAAAVRRAVEAGELRRPPPDAPPRIVRALTRALAADRDARFADVRALAAAFVPPPARAWGFAAAVAAVGLAAVTFGVVVSQRGDRCADVAAIVDDTLAANRRAQIAAAFAASPLPYARTTWAHLDAKLDAVGARTRRVLTSVCSDESIDEQTRAARAACATRAAQDLEALVALLAEGGPTVIESSTEAAARLDPPEACLERRAGRPPAASLATTTVAATATAPPSEGRFAALGATLAKARQLSRSGRPDDAAPLVTEVVDGARAAGLTALWAEALLERGLLERERRADAARPALLAAAAAGEAAGVDELKATAWTQLLEVAADETVDLAAAEEARAFAEATLAHVPARPDLQGRLTVAHARLLMRRGDHTAAAAVLTPAIAEPGLDPVEAASRLNLLATAEAGRGQHAASLAALDDALLRLVSAVGDSHPKVAAIHSNRVEALFFLERRDEALAAGQRALTIYERTVPADDPRLTAALDNVGVVYALTGRLDDALAASTRALALSEQRLGADHADVATSHLNVASMLRDAGRTAEAMPHYDKARAIWVAKLGAEHGDVARVDAGMGNALLDEGDAAAAVTRFESALRIRERADVDPLHLAESRFALARALAKRGRAGDEKRARALAAEALAVFRTRAPDRVAEVETWRAEAWRANP